MQQRGTPISITPKERWSSYSALAQSFRKTHNDHELLRAAAKGALSMALPLTIATLPTQQAQAQSAICSPVNAAYMLTGYNPILFDIDQDGMTDAVINYVYASANDLRLQAFIAPGVPGARIAASNTVYNAALNIPSGASIPGGYNFYTNPNPGTTAFRSAALYTIKGSVPNGNFQSGTTGNIVIETSSGSIGWINLTVNTINNVTINFIGFEGSNGGADGLGTAVIGNCATLPVELTYFKTQASAKTIQLNWATASETNNVGFEIERSKDGERFRKIGFVKGHGTTVEAQEYAFEDNNVFANTTYYYRLKQVDDDGTFAYSEVQTVILKKENDIQVSDLFPNPATTEVQFQVNTAAEGTAIVELFNSTGQQLRTFQEGVQAGTNTLNLHVADLPKGTYFAKVKVGEQQVYKKLILAD